MRRFDFSHKLSNDVNESRERLTARRGILAGNMWLSEISPNGRRQTAVILRYRRRYERKRKPSFIRGTNRLVRSVAPVGNIVSMLNIAWTSPLETWREREKKKETWTASSGALSSTKFLAFVESCDVTSSRDCARSSQGRARIHSLMDSEEGCCSFNASPFSVTKEKTIAERKDTRCV